MIRIKLNGNTRIIPEAHELTVSEYIKLANSDGKTLFDYLAITLQLSKDALLDAEIRNYFTIERKIGTLSDPFEVGRHVEKEPAAYIKKMKLQNVKLNKVGHRMLFESKAKTTDNTFELALFVLSMAHLPTVFDFDVINANVKQFETMAYIQILPVAAFFLRNFMIQYQKEPNFYKKFQLNIRTKMFQLKKKPALMRFKITVLSLNFKEFRTLLIYRLKNVMKLTK